MRSFYVLTIWVCNFLRKDFGAKAAHKMLVKLTPESLGVRKTSLKANLDFRFQLLMQFQASEISDCVSSNKIVPKN
jgi:hypothetical protein